MKKTAEPKALDSKTPDPKVADTKTLKEIIVVTTTTSRKDEAETLAAELVSRRLAGCVQIVGPITSAFHWQGKVEHSEEWLCQIKSRRDKYAELEAVLKQLHPYDVPEIIALPVAAGLPAYLEWVGQCCAPHS